MDTRLKSNENGPLTILLADDDPDDRLTVSYTHLTLPTIYAV